MKPFVLVIEDDSDIAALVTKNLEAVGKRQNDIEAYRDMTASMLDIYLSSVSNRLNETMRVLTVIATVFIPPTFLASVYGMNFDRGASPWNMPELGWAHGYLALWAVMLITMIGMLFYFKRKKWF